MLKIQYKVSTAPHQCWKHLAAVGKLNSLMSCTVPNTSSATTFVKPNETIRPGLQLVVGAEVVVVLMLDLWIVVMQTSLG